MSEYEHHSKKHSDDESPDVEAHKHRIKRGDEGPTPTEVEHHSKKHTNDEDDGPDVEAHLFQNR